jgi:hypothetical protein
MIADDGPQLLKELGNLLDRQVELARRGSFGQLERLVGRCEPLVVKIKAAGLLERPDYKAQSRRVVKLYHDLQLMLSTQKNAVAEQLKSIRRGKRTLAAYRGNMWRPNCD